jgi:PIN domain nuclease of toxin-antitoxin system
MGSDEMIILDTHIWLWWLNDAKPQLGEEWSGIISTSTNIAISAISCFEVAWLERHGRIELPMALADWFDKATSGSGIEIIPITPKIAETAVDLPEHHSDPQDRLIMATAIVNQAKLLSADAKFKSYKELEGILI